ncbi:hypothetical protein HK101_002217, partial [Irineochytrium annulatum]
MLSIPEILSTVLHYLSALDLRSLRLVSRHFHNMARDQAHRRSLDLLHCVLILNDTRRPVQDNGAVGGGPHPGLPHHYPAHHHHQLMPMPNLAVLAPAADGEDTASSSTTTASSTTDSSTSSTASMTPTLAPQLTAQPVTVGASFTSVVDVFEHALTMCIEHAGVDSASSLARAAVEEALTSMPKGIAAGVPIGPDGIGGGRGRVASVLGSLRFVPLTLRCVDHVLMDGSYLVRKFEPVESSTVVMENGVLASRYIYINEYVNDGCLEGIATTSVRASNGDGPRLNVRACARVIGHQLIRALHSPLPKPSPFSAALNNAANMGMADMDVVNNSDDSDEDAVGAWYATQQAQMQAQHALAAAGIQPPGGVGVSNGAVDNGSHAAAMAAASDLRRRRGGRPPFLGSLRDGVFGDDFVLQFAVTTIHGAETVETITDVEEDARRRRRALNGGAAGMDVDPEYEHVAAAAEIGFKCGMLNRGNPWFKRQGL